MKELKKQLLIWIVLSLSFCAACSGSLEQPGFISIFSPENNGTVLKNAEILDSNIIKLTFEGSVSELTAYTLRDNSEEKDACSVEKEKTQKGYIFTIKPLRNFAVGEKFKLEGRAKTGIVTLDFSLPFQGFNSKPAELAFYSLKLGNSKTPGYIKLKVRKAGNLFGLRILNSAAKKNAIYIFPPAEAYTGEIIVYHWFLPQDEASAVDEIFSPNECKAEGAFAGERDFWHRITKFSPKKTNAILLKDSGTDRVLDAVIFMQPDDKDWKNAEVELAVKEAVKAEKWHPDAEAENAFQANITPKAELKRKSLQNISYSARDWVLEKRSTKTSKKSGRIGKKKKS